MTYSKNAPIISLRKKILFLLQTRKDNTVNIGALETLLDIKENRVLYKKSLHLQNKKSKRSTQRARKKHRQTKYNINDINNNYIQVEESQYPITTTVNSTNNQDYTPLQNWMTWEHFSMAQDKLYRSIVKEERDSQLLRNEQMEHGVSFQLDNILDLSINPNSICFNNGLLRFNTQ